LTCEQIADVLPIWDGDTCGPAHEQIARLVEAKRAEIADRIREARALRRTARRGRNRTRQLTATGAMPHRSHLLRT